MVNYPPKILDNLAEIVKKNPVDVVVHVGTNDLSNNVNTFAATVFFAANRRLPAKKFGRTIHCHAFLAWRPNFTKPIFRNNPCYML